MLLLHLPVLDTQPRFQSMKLQLRAMGETCPIALCKQWIDFVQHIQLVLQAITSKATVCSSDHLRAVDNVSKLYNRSLVLYSYNMA